MARPRRASPKDSIKVVVYIGDPAKNPLQAARSGVRAPTSSPATAKETYQGYVDLFAKYYETYGRKIDLKFFDGTGGPMDEVAARADAKAIADMHPFAVLNGANQTPAWSDELAAQRHHVPRQLLARRARELHQGPRAVHLRHRPDARAGRRCSPPSSSPTC